MRYRLVPVESAETSATPAGPGPSVPPTSLTPPTIEIDTAQQRVWVGGAEVACQPRVYLLLSMLCEAGGAVVTREEVFARLWRGQVVTSDESLTQVVHRLRAMLGRAGGAVRTVRGVGFRRDARVEAVAPESGMAALAPQPGVQGAGPAASFGVVSPVASGEGYPTRPTYGSGEAAPAGSWSSGQARAAGSGPAGSGPGGKEAVAGSSPTAVAVSGQEALAGGWASGQGTAAGSGPGGERVAAGGSSAAFARNGQVAGAGAGGGELPVIAGAGAAGAAGDAAPAPVAGPVAVQAAVPVAVRAAMPAAAPASMPAPVWGGAVAVPGAAAPAAVAGPVAPPPAAARRRSSRARLVAAVLGGVLAVGVGGVWWAAQRSAEVIDSRFDLVRGDFAGARAETIELVTRALATERTGDRAQARHLLEIASESDSGTAVPPALRGLFSRWQENPQEAARWAAEAERRLRGRSTPYLRLLVRYVRAQAAGRDTEWLAADSALLTLRPAAWYMRLARAHFHLARREEAAALADLEAIPIPRLDDQSLAYVLADRAALGDAAGAERDLAASQRPGQEALAWYVRGRIARSDRRPLEARADFDREAAAALRSNEPDLLAEALTLGGMAAVEAGDLADAAARFDHAALQARDDLHLDQAADALGLGAWLAWRRGDAPGRDRRLAEAGAVQARPAEAYRAALALLAAWTGASPAAGLPAIAAALPEVEELAGVDELMLGRAAWAAGDRQEAVRRLQRARAGGVERTYFREEAALLAADLGEPPRLLRVDPPYPILLRFAAARELDRRRAGVIQKKHLN